MKHTPEPWRWELNEESRDVQLCGGNPKYDMTVMDFVRWGMGGATPRFNFTLETRGLQIMEPAKKFSKPVEGREHHASWFKSINHPDANRIVDCVNACQGIEDPAAAIQAARDALEAARPELQATCAMAKAYGTKAMCSEAALVSVDEALKLLKPCPM